MIRGLGGAPEEAPVRLLVQFVVATIEQVGVNGFFELHKSVEFLTAAWWRWLL